MSIRAYVCGRDDDELLRLRRAVWGKEHAHNDAKFFAWLFDRNPDGPGGGVLIDNAGEALGFAGLVTRRMVLRGREISVAIGMDYMIHPEHRNGFGASRLVKSWLTSVGNSGYAFGLCFPNASSYRILTARKLGWQRVCELRMLARPLGAVDKLPGKLSRLPSWLLAPVFRSGAWLCSLRAALLSPSAPPGQEVEITCFDARFDALWRAAKIGTGTVRDAAHLNWRYREHPLYTYKTLAWVHDERVLGYVVITHREVFDLKSVLIVDVLAEPAAHGVIEALVQAVVRYARGIGACMLSTQVIPGSHLSAAFRRAGLLVVPPRVAPKTFTLTAHGLLQALPPLDEANWHFTWGDMDVI